MSTRHSNLAGWYGTRRAVRKPQPAGSVFALEAPQPGGYLPDFPEKNVNLPGALGPGVTVDSRLFPRVRDQNPKVAKVVNYA